MLLGKPITSHIKTNFKSIHSFDSVSIPEISIIWSIDHYVHHNNENSKDYMTNNLKMLQLSIHMGADEQEFLCMLDQI